jgi:hypothetical protein
MVSTVANPTVTEARQTTRGTTLARAVRSAGARQLAETRPCKPARSFLTALLRSLSAFAA